MKKCKLLIILITSVLLTACGFHLRGQQPLPPALHTVYLTPANSKDPLIKELRQTLRSLNINIVDQRNQAPVTLEVRNLGTDRVLTGISADAQTRTYLLISNMQFQLFKADGQALLPSQGLSITRNLVTTSDQILSTDYEYDRIQQEMYQELITQLINRLYTFQISKALKNV